MSDVLNEFMNEFIIAACVPRDASHSDGTTDRANALLAAHPELATVNIHTAAILGDAVTVRRFIAADAVNVKVKGGPHNWDALTHLCFSQYLKCDETRTPGFVDAATALLDAGADANSGWFEHEHEPRGTWESVLYGAAGIARNPALTRLLVSRGADVNDGETPYHTPESYDNRAMEVLVESGRMTRDNITMMLVRKHDVHDYDGAKYLLEHGADPNVDRERGWSPFHHALKRGNALRMIELLLNHGADPSLVHEGMSGLVRAVREGRGDVLGVFEKRGLSVDVKGVDRLIAACARADDTTVNAMAAREPDLVRQLVAMGGTLLAKFTSNANGDGVRRLLDLGVPPDAPFVQGDGYFGIAQGSLPIHVAAWRAQPAIVRVLLERGSPVDVRDTRGRTPLMLAVSACVDSYWTERATPESVQLLADAGASVQGAKYPSGDDRVDAVLKAHGA